MYIDIKNGILMGRGLTMNIEKIRKINELSRELKRTGFAQWSNDAAVQASEVYNGELSFLEESAGEVPAESQKSAGGNDSQVGSEPRILSLLKNTEQNCQMMVNMKFRTVEQALVKLQEANAQKVAALESEVAQLRRDMRDIKTVQQPQPQITSSPTMSAVPAQPQVQGAFTPPVSAQAAPSLHAQTGSRKEEISAGCGFTRADIAVDKIFYYGKK